MTRTPRRRTTRWSRTRRRAELLFVLLVGAAVLVACGADAADAPIPGAAVAVDDPLSGGYPTFDDEATGLRIVFGTPDLGPGRSRVSFALFSADGLVSYPSLHIESRHYPGGAGEPYEAGEVGTVTFYRFPEGGRGIYVGNLDFPVAGLWSLAVQVPQSDGTTAEVVVPVEVGSRFVAPAIGDVPPASQNRTSGDGTPLEALTTASDPDPALYDMTIAEALATSTPFVVTFASPAFCTNALCGPQDEVLSELQADYGDDAEFIHVDLYENPLEIRGDFSLAKRTPVLDEWGIHTDEWTFVVDATGRVTARFEGFAPREEVEPALRAALGLPEARSPALEGR